jgi:hypothetical protein
LTAAARWLADQRAELEHLCRYITRPAIANERLKRNRAGQVVLQLKSLYKGRTDSTLTSDKRLRTVARYEASSIYSRGRVGEGYLASRVADFLNCHPSNVTVRFRRIKLVD